MYCSPDGCRETTKDLFCRVQTPNGSSNLAAIWVVSKGSTSAIWDATRKIWFDRSALAAAGTGARSVSNIHSNTLASGIAGARIITNIHFHTLASINPHARVRPNNHV
jgi:hypothetical protein